MRRSHDVTALLLVVLLVPAFAVGASPAMALADEARAVPVGMDGPTVAPSVDPDAYDLALESGRTHWAGQRLSFDGSAVVPEVGSASTGERTFQVRRVASGDDVGPLVREFVVDADGEAVVDTAGVDGELLVVYDGDPVYVQGGTGYADSLPDGTAVTVGNSAWDVAVQTLSASWSDDRVTRNEVVDLRIESNRGFFLVAVSADGLDFEDLEAIFDPHFYAIDHDAKADDDVIILRAGNDVDVPAYFAGIDDGEYTLSIEVVDADVATTADVRVGRIRPTTTAEPPAATTAPPEPTTTTVGLAPSPSPVTTPRTATTSGPTTAGPGTTATPGQSGFGALTGTLAVVAGVVLARRRRA